MDGASKRQDRILVLGGKPIGSCELVDYAHTQEAYVIVADYLPVEESPAKQLADECWDVSTADLDALEAKCRASGVTAVMAGVHEFNIEKSIELCERLGLPAYCSSAQLDLCTDKARFKEACRSFCLPVAREYSETEARQLTQSAFPLAVKPVDGSGSRGFSKCESKDDLEAAIVEARRFSDSGEVLIEEFIDADAVIIHYTMHDGVAIYSGMADKHSRCMGDGGSPIMALQIAPSLYEAEYIARHDRPMRGLLESAGMKDGPVWIEAFCGNGAFVFNEIGYRFGGSLTYHLVKELCGIDQLDLFYASACGAYRRPPQPQPTEDCLFAIWPTHLRAGRIALVEGVREVVSDPAVTAFVPVHGMGDTIENWGSAQQVFAYIHLKASDGEDLLRIMRRIAGILNVRDERGHELLHALFDPTDKESLPLFVEQRLKLRGEYFDE